MRRVEARIDDNNARALPAERALAAAVVKRQIEDPILSPEVYGVVGFLVGILLASRAGFFVGAARRRAHAADLGLVLERLGGFGRAICDRKAADCAPIDVLDLRADRRRECRRGLAFEWRAAELDDVATFDVAWGRRDAARGQAQANGEQTQVHGLGTK